MTAPRPLPHDWQLEEHLLAGLMLDPEQWPEVTALPGSVFTNPAARAVFEVMQTLHDQGDPIDDHALILQRASSTDARNYVTTTYLTGLAISNASGYLVPNYARELRALHGRREAMRAAQKFLHHASEGDLSGQELIDLASRIALPIEARSRNQFTTHASAVDEAMARLRAGKPRALSTGFSDLDDLILGLEPGAFYILGARPGMGKTGLGYNIMLNVARKGHAGAVASLEMPAHQLVTRALASEASVNLQSIRHHKLTPRELERLDNAAVRLRGLPITFLDNVEQSLPGLLADARQLRARGQLDVLMIDYIQLLDGNDTENRQQEISQISRALKTLAMELEIPVLGLSQLSRAVEQRPNPRPKLSDLRESGSLEQDADCVMFIYRDEYYNQSTDQQGQAEVIIPKQRSGPVDTVKLSYNGEFVRFGNLTTGYGGQA